MQLLNKPFVWKYNLPSYPEYIKLVVLTFFLKSKIVQTIMFFDIDRNTIYGIHTVLQTRNFKKIGAQTLQKKLQL